MKMSELNEALSILANLAVLAVLAGIIFVGLEIRQNTLTMQAQTRDSMTEKQMEWYHLRASDSGLAREYQKIFTGEEDADWTRLRPLLRSQFRMWENEYYQYQIGMFEDEEFEPRMVLWGNVLENEPYRNYWIIARESHSPEFARIMDSLIE